jgi:hypothetical protein
VAEEGCCWSVSVCFSADVLAAVMVDAVVDSVVSEVTIEAVDEAVFAFAGGFWFAVAAASPDELVLLLVSLSSVGFSLSPSEAIAGGVWSALSFSVSLFFGDDDEDGGDGSEKSVSKSSDKMSAFQLSLEIFAGGVKIVPRSALEKPFGNVLVAVSVEGPWDRLKKDEIPAPILRPCGCGGAVVVDDSSFLPTGVSAATLSNDDDSDTSDASVAAAVVDSGFWYLVKKEEIPNREEDGGAPSSISFADGRVDEVPRSELSNKSSEVVEVVPRSEAANISGFVSFVLGISGFLPTAADFGKKKRGRPEGLVDASDDDVSGFSVLVV